MRIINLTQHSATVDQLLAGVIDIDPSTSVHVRALLNFGTLPSRQEIEETAQELAEIAAMHDLSDDEDHPGIYPTHAMIGGAPWLMSALEAALMDRFVTPLYAFSVRESVEKPQPDGSVRKVNVFKHAGFVTAK